MVERILFLIIGAFLTYLGTVVKAWFDKRNYVSAHLFELRIEALNVVWHAFNEMKEVFACRIAAGYVKWKSDYGQEAKQTLEQFRSTVDRAQVILPAEFIDVLRKIDEVYFSYYDTKDDKEMRPSNFVNQVNDLLDTLTVEINQRMSRQHHSIRLRLRT